MIIFEEFSRWQVKNFVFLVSLLLLNKVLRVVLSRAPISHFGSSAASISAMSSLISKIDLSFAIVVISGAYQQDKAALSLADTYLTVNSLAKLTKNFQA